MGSANKGSLLSFPTQISFISFSGRIALPLVLSSMLNRSAEGERPFLLLDFRRKAFCLYPFSIMLAACLNGFCQSEIRSSTPIYNFFVDYDWVLDFVKWLFLLR